MFDKTDLKSGFWLGIGLLLAVLVWGVVVMFFGKVAKR